MPVYPWDPELQIEQIFTLEADDWNVKRLHINSHDWTHVNVPAHSKQWGNCIDDYQLSAFIWPAIIYQSEYDISTKRWIIFHDIDITMEIAHKLVRNPPLFVWLSSQFNFNLKVEKYLLDNNIISFENLENTDKLPNKFQFHWVPLNIKDWDGSPVRAYAIIDSVIN